MSTIIDFYKETTSLQDMLDMNDMWIFGEFGTYWRILKNNLNFINFGTI